ncbi:hypothetical protein DSL92_05240 [Billgrantia gudaonensis]|uniref:Uncharacterized protein n=1 Tax=Billgrantia gudaonensis TaxID=376427 RepID=A0A3S0R528_9GAMM|nr:hypothetical protein DSL92_05240 [Halomonas gudaonensis]
MTVKELDATQMYLTIASRIKPASCVPLPRLPDRWIVGILVQSEWQPQTIGHWGAGIRRQHMDVKIDSWQKWKERLRRTLYNVSALYDFENGHQAWTSYERFD